VCLLRVTNAVCACDLCVFVSRLNLRTIAVMWEQFVQELRFHFENAIPLPRLGSSMLRLTCARASPIERTNSLFSLWTMSDEMLVTVLA
jgi:hypothetical protein